VWPDLVYTEMISLIVCSIVLIVWSILLKAPLEQPANPANTPNPSKAPWHSSACRKCSSTSIRGSPASSCRGLIIVGLICIPYRQNPKGNGYYTFNERKAEVTIFLFGFVILWISLIVLGTFLRGPNWNFFGPFEFWDIHKLAALTNVNLSGNLGPRPAHGAADQLADPRDLRVLLVLVYVLALPIIRRRACSSATTTSSARRATT
jgi:hypothetical protein